MIVYHELLPEAYLLVLAADPTPGLVPEAELAALLRQAARSGKPAVWVDCRLLPTLSRPAGALPRVGAAGAGPGAGPRPRRRAVPGA
jgi:hypothetical protein